jgi:hypothetical protein
MLLFQIFGGATSGNDLFDKVKLLNTDIPDGFIYGIVPKYAKDMIKDNPWELDQAAIKKLADQIYPGGDYSKISGIHVSILAKKSAPFGDDIVCYIILFKDAKAANDEIKKMSEFAGFNQDRVIIETKNNLAVYLHVDDVRDYPLIRAISEKIRERLKNI